MSRTGLYIGGHTVITQCRQSFEGELARKAVRAKKRIRRNQVEFDQARANEKAAILAKIEKADIKSRRPWMTEGTGKGDGKATGDV